MDVDSIDSGVDFVDAIDDMVAKVDVMIAIRFGRRDIHLNVVKD